MSRLVGQYNGIVCSSRGARDIRRKLRRDLLARYQLQTGVPAIELRLTLAANLLDEAKRTQDARAATRAAANLESAERLAAQLQRNLWKQGNRATNQAKPKESNEQRLARIARLKALHESK